MEDNTGAPYNYAQYGVSQILNNPYTKYRTPTIYLDGPLEEYAGPTRYSKAHYRIEYMKDGTAIYYRKNPQAKKFCCFF